jgi:hypothetical protein
MVQRASATVSQKCVNATGPHFCARSSFNQHGNERGYVGQTRRKGDNCDEEFKGSSEEAGNPYANAFPVAPQYLYGRNLPVMPRLTRSPLGSALRDVHVEVDRRHDAVAERRKPRFCG